MYLKVSVSDLSLCRVFAKYLRTLEPTRKYNKVFPFLSKIRTTYYEQIKFIQKLFFRPICVHCRNIIIDIIR